MASQDASEILFSLSGVRERMREKKKSALKTAKLNASIASKIKTKIINNSSSIKVSLKHNNKALALALNGMKANVQQLTQEKTVLQKEVEECHFQNAVLRHKLSFMDNAMKELENIMAAVKTAQLSEFHTISAPLWNGRKSSITEDSWANDIADVPLVRATGMPMRVPISKPCDGCTSTAVQTSSLDFLSHASNDPLEVVPIASKDTSPPEPAEKPQSPQEKNEKITEAMEAQEVFLGSCIFGEAFCTTKKNPNILPALPLESHSLSHESDEIAKHLLDRLSQGYVTQRRKYYSLITSSTPSSGVDVFPPVSSTQAAECCIMQDSSSSRKSNTEPQLKSPSSLVSPTQTTVTPDRKSLGKEIFCDQPQHKETGCGVEMDPTYSRVPEFVPVKAKNKGNCKTGEKKPGKKASMGKKNPNAIKKKGESSPDRPQGEETAQNTKKLLQPKVATCLSESEVSETRQKGCMQAFDRNNTGCGTEQYSCFPAEVFLSRRTYVVNPAQLHSPESSDLLQQVKKDTTFEIQHMESLPESPVCTVSSLEAPPDDSSLQNSLFLRKETSSACALQEDSSVSTKSIRQKTNRKTRIIRQRGDSEEENLPNSVKTAEAKAEGQPKRSQASRRKTVRKGSCHDQRNEVDVFGPCINVQGVTEESTEDLQDNLKRSRKTYIVSPLDLAENLGCVQTDFKDSDIAPPRSVPGSKASKIPRAHTMVAAQNTTKGLQEKGQARVDNNMSTSEKESCPKRKLQRENTTSRPPETDSLARQSDGAKVLIASSAELASKQTVLTGKISCIADLPDPDAYLEEQMANTDLSCLKSSPVTYSAALSVSSWLTDAPVSRSLSTEGNTMPEKSSVWLESFLISREKTAEEVPGEGSQVKPSFQGSPSQEPGTRPLQDLTNASALSSSSSEGVTGRSSKRKQEPGCYKEPKLNSKLRQGDPFTNTEFLNNLPSKTKRKKTAKAKKITKKIKKEKE